MLPVETQATRFIPSRTRLGDAAGHAVVFERAGGIEALVLECQIGPSPPYSAAWARAAAACCLRAG